MSRIEMITVADHAQIVNGNLYAMGLGWNWCASPTPPMTVVTRTLVAPSRFDEGQLAWTFALVNGDGQATDLGGLVPSVTWAPSGTAPDGRYPGAEVPVWALFGFPPLELARGRWQWRIGLDEAAGEYAFTVV